MSPVTYASLKKDQRCVYQAFGNLAGVTDTAAEMGKYVNDLGIDADDDAAVHALAEKYGLTEIEMFLGASWNAGDYNLEKNCEYVLTINGQRSMIADFSAFNETMLKGKSAVQKIQKKYPNEVGHAVYCKTKTTRLEVETWTDIQGIYKKPAPNFSVPTLVVAYGRARID